MIFLRHAALRGGAKKERRIPQAYRLLVRLRLAVFTDACYKPELFLFK